MNYKAYTNTLLADGSITIETFAVPGGWLYIVTKKEGVSTTFVPEDYR